MYVTNNSTKIAASMNGMMERLILSREIPAMPLLTKRQTPRGGVVRPMTRFRTITAPKWIGSRPNCFANGRRTGVRMINEAVVSMKVPTNRRKRLIMMRINQRLLMLTVRKAIIFCGSCKAATSQPKMAALAMINMMTAVTTRLSRIRSGSWRQLSYRQTRERVRSIAQALIGRGLSLDRGVAILSGNDIDHALLALAALYVGVPYAPISPPYALVSSDFGKLRHVLGLLTPGLVFAASGKRFERALTAAVPPGVEIVVGQDRPSALKVTELESLAASPGEASPSQAQAARAARQRGGAAPCG